MSDRVGRSPRRIRQGLLKGASAVALGSLAAVAALVVAPQASMAGFWLAAGWAPHGAVLLLGVVFYEAGLWASGLAVLLGAWRLGLGRGRLQIYVTFACILVGEALFALLTNTPLAAYAWATGIIARVVTGVGTVALASKLGQPRK